MGRKERAERRRYYVGVVGVESRWTNYEASDPREAVHRYCEAHRSELLERYPFGLKAWTDWGGPWEHFRTWDVDVSRPPAWIIRQDKSEREIREGT